MGGTSFARLIDRRGLTQSEVAEASGLNKNLINQLYSGTYPHRPRGRTILCLSEAFEMDFDEMETIIAADLPEEVN